MTRTVEDLEKQIFELMGELAQARATAQPEEVPDYSFETTDGTVTLSQLFGDRDKLIAVHNMGQGCRYCTLWADGFNGFVPHLEDAASFVVLSKDAPAVQRRFANERGWRFRMASHGGGKYLTEQGVQGEGNHPGVVCYEKRDGKIFKLNKSNFGPGDTFCSMWSLLSLIGLDATSWTPQYSYWKRPKTMCDGGQNLKS
jgi:predicted dithiol-disulfide oxidoreductase (DUF899 family)